MKMKEYPKIKTIFKRDPKERVLVAEDYSSPELEMLRKINWEWTEKVAGMNIRIGYEAKKFTFGGGTDKTEIPETLKNTLLQIVHNRKEQIAAKFESVVFYGEGYGPGIQEGEKYRGDPGFVLFDIYVGGAWLDRGAVKRVAKELRLDLAPIIYRGKMADIIRILRGDDSSKSKWGDFKVDGAVGRPVCELFDRLGNRILAKLKTEDIELWDNE